MIAALPSLPQTYSAPLLNLTINLTSAQIFTFRVPHSTIELKISTTHNIDGQSLGDGLLRLHEYLNDHIAEHGDGWLAPKDDPFGWVNSGPTAFKAGLALNVPRHISLTAQSVPGEQMTWSILLIAVEGLYLCLPAVGRNLGAQFDIWDWRDQAQWGFGEVKAGT